MRPKKVKRIVSLFIALAIVVSLVPSVFSASIAGFTDFPTGWSREAMTAVVDNGLLNGRSATEIVPQGELTRAEMVTIINRAFGATIEADIKAYRDVAPTAWYYHEIAKAVNMQTLTGDSAIQMRPDDAITREEVFTVIARAIVLENASYSSLDRFADGTNVSDWAKRYVSAFTAKGYVNGDDAGKLNPKANITREEFAQVMHNIIKTYYTEKGVYTTSGQGSSLIRTTDVNLKDVTINGDLIIGDGVGNGSVTLTNVTIRGRLICRGGEKLVKLVDVKAGGNVVIKDVNGIVNFDNYRTESVFNGIEMVTKAKFLVGSPADSDSTPETKPKHIHKWATEWTTDGEYHWHECTAPGCTITNDAEKNGYERHSYTKEEENLCYICGHKNEAISSEHIHIPADKWSMDDTYHWKECEADNCPATQNSQKYNYEMHKYSDSKDEYCDVCNYHRDVFVVNGNR